MKLRYIITIGILLVLLVTTTCNYFSQKDKIESKPSIWIRTWYPQSKNHAGSGRNYNDLLKLNDNQYLYIGTDFLGNTFDSTIITFNK